MTKNELETPVLMIDLDAMARNLKKMADSFERMPSSLRPHTKSHRTPAIAHKQVQAGARGICCGTLDDAEVMISSGITDVLVTREIVLPQTISRAVGLAKHSEIMIIVDNEEIVGRFSHAAELEGVKVRALVDVLTRLGRSGVPPGEPAIALARKVSESKGLIFMGFMGYEGSMHGWDSRKREEACSKSLKLLIETKQAAEQVGIEVRVVSAGATSTHRTTGMYPGVTEVQAGSYLTMDADYFSFFPEFEVAATVMTTVISRPTRYEITTDAGLKKLSQDNGLPQIKGADGIEMVALNEEHGRLRLTDPGTQVRVGDRIEIIPSHCGAAFNMYDRVCGMRDDRLEVIWGIGARGR